MGQNIDAMMILASTGQKETRAGNKATVLSKNVVSVFHYLKRDRLMTLLTEAGLGRRQITARISCPRDPSLKAGTGRTEAGQ